MNDLEKLDILLVEDNNADADWVFQLFADSAVNINRVATLAEAAAEMGYKKPSIMLLDLNLPDSDSTDTLAFVSLNRRKLPIIVMSGHDVLEIRLRAIQSGAQDYLVKGEFDAKLLSRAINYAIERHQLQRQLRNYAKKLNDQRLKLIEAQALAEMGNWELDVFNLQLTWSSQAMQILELNNANTTLPAFFESVVDADQQLLREVFRQAIEDDSEFNIDIAYKMPFGELKYLNLRLRSNHAKVLEKKVVVGTIQDITSRKMIEDDLKESEEKYHNLFEESRDAIYITTRDGSFIEFNTATTELFGYDKHELQQLNVRDLYLNPFERVKFTKEIEEKGFVRDFEVKLRKRNGKKIDCVITSTLWKSNDGRQIGYQGVIRDITERRNAEELLKEKEVAERSGKLKEQFLANMSHEIRTPINAISGLTHLLLQSKLDVKQHEYISGIRSSSEHLLELVNDILDFSKIEANQVHFESIPFNLKQILEQTIGTVRYKAADKKLDLVLDVDSEVPVTLKGDPLRLKQIIINLLSNAIKFTNDGSVKLLVRVIERSNQDYVLSFVVEDTGIGIPENKLDSIFSSFTQLGYDVAKPEGTGLGLTITKQLVELQGGTITVKSKVGDGSTFKVVLKYKMEDAQDDHEKDASFKFVDQDLGNKRILLVEDKPLNQLVAKEMLLQWWPKVTVDIADNGKIAIDRLTVAEYDLVLMDVQMPEMDGYTATRKIRNDFAPPKSEVPILAMTAYATTGEVEKCLQAGMNDYISKPFEPSQLYDKILNLMSGNVYVATKQVLDAVEPAIDSSEPEHPNFNYLNQLSGGNETLKQQIIHLLIKETPEELDKLLEYTAAADWVRVRGVAHKMKSTATYMGMKETLDKLKQIEENASNAVNIEQIPILVASVDENLVYAIEMLKG